MVKKLTVKAFLLVKHNGKLLAHRVISSPKLRLIRPPGGHVEYGEESSDTIRREMREELKTGIKNLRLLGVLENIFRAEGKLYHEVDFVYSGDLRRMRIYSDKATEIVEKNNRRFNAFWVPIRDIMNGRETFVPRAMKQFLNKVS